MPTLIEIGFLAAMLAPPLAILVGALALVATSLTSALSPKQAVGDPHSPMALHHPVSR